jgi:hypothetical protein
MLNLQQLLLLSLGELNIKSDDERINFNQIERFQWPFLLVPTALNHPQMLATMIQHAPKG